MEDEITPEMIEEAEAEQAFDTAEAEEDRYQGQQEFNEAYGSPEPDEKQNQHSFLHKAAWGSEDTIKTTFLSESELGRPLFSVRFLLDMKTISDHYLENMSNKFDVINKISPYFLQKAMNIADSGMSNEGFAMNLNVTKKMDTTRTRFKNSGNIENLQGRKKRRR